MFDRLKQSSRGAIDLASIMVGIIVIGLVGGVIAATIFTIIPWAQDNAAKSQLDAIATAQSAYAGFAASEASGLGSLAALNFQPTAVEGNKKFASLEQLNAKGLFKSDLKEGSSTVSADGKLCSSFDAVAGKFDAAVVSGSSNVFTISATNMTPTKVIDGDTCVGTVVDGKIDLNPPRPAVMVSTWNTSLPGCTTITLPLSVAVKADVDWGDGIVSTSVSDEPYHTYADTPSEKIITVIGTFSKWNMETTETTSHCITKVNSWGETGTTDLSYSFYGASNLTEVKEIPTGVTNMLGMFAASTFNGDVSKWNTSNVTDMSYMFYKASIFNGDVSNWNTSNVTDMSNMFAESDAFNGDVNKWDTSKVTTMRSMFNIAKAFNGDVSKWNTGNVTDMSNMFQGASVFNGDVSKWNTDNVTNMRYMFYAASVFNGDVSKWNTGNVTDMESIFQSASVFNGDVSQWNTSNVTKMYGMFYNALKFNQNLSGWNVIKVTAWGQFKTGSALSDANTPVKFK